MHSLFNSLGSNYSFEFVLHSLVATIFSGQSELEKLKSQLKKVYSGTEVLTVYKGRDAIEACLRVLLPSGSTVITQAFSCSAVEEGLVRAKMKPVYADIGKTGSNMTLETISQAYKKHPQAIAVLVQHSLGVPADSIAIKQWCTKHGLLLIEDLAQGVGGVDTLGNDVGSTADAVVFSFGRDKIVDAVSGGAVVFRMLTKIQKERLIKTKNMIARLPILIVITDMLYPIITFLIRTTHHFGLGKVIFVVAKKIGLLSNPVISKTHQMCWMHPAYAKLALIQFKNISKQIEHRKKISRQYVASLEGISVKWLVDTTILKMASNLRMNFVCENKTQVERIISGLKKEQIYVSDRWYREAVDCGSFACKTAYILGECPNAEKLVDRIVNLPTHRNISVNDVVRICAVIRNIL